MLKSYNQVIKEGNKRATEKVKEHKKMEKRKQSQKQKINQISLLEKEKQPSPVKELTKQHLSK